jgi:hypothetical protein
MNTTLPPLPSKTGHRGKHVFPPDGHIVGYEIIDEVRIPHTGFLEKIICLQRIKFDHGAIELRLGYYIIGKKPRMKGKWVWGQFAATMPAQDLLSIVELAKTKGWFQ